MSGRRRCVGALVVLTVSIIVGAGCSTSSTPSASLSPSSSATNIYQADRHRAVSTTLNRLAAALHDGNKQAIDGLLDPLATPAFADAMRQASVNIAAAQLSALTFTIGSPNPADGLGEQLVPGDLQRRLDDTDATDSWVVPVTVKYAFAGIKQPSATLSRPLVMARHGDNWTIIGDAGPLLGMSAPLAQFWDYPDVQARRVPTDGATSLVLHYPDSGEVSDRATAALPAAINAVTSFWGGSWNRNVVAIATDSASAFESLARGAGDTSAAAAATVSADDNPTPSSPSRIVLAPNAQSLTPDALSEILRHELTHVAAASVTAKNAPLWLTEGVAEWVGRHSTFTRLADATPDLAMACRGGMCPTVLPEDKDFAVAGPQAQLAYQTAFSFTSYVAHRFTPTRLRALYLAGARTPTNLDAAAATTLGAAFSQIIRDWAQWLPSHIEPPVTSW